MDKFRLILGDRPYEILHKDIDSETGLLKRWEIATTDESGDRVQIEYSGQSVYERGRDRIPTVLPPTIRVEL